MRKLALAFHLIFMVAALLFATPNWAASFDCKQASTEIEKLICSDYPLSRLDSKLGVFYGKALEKVADPDALKVEQLEWLKERNHCTDVRCLKKRYDRRVDELRVLAAGHPLWEPPPAMTPVEIERVYVTERRETLKALFKDRPLETTLGKDDPLCADFMRDFTAQTEAIELLPPSVAVHDYDDPQLQKAIFDHCPDMELRSYKIGRSGPYVGPRNFLLYQVDIDNNLANGEELLFLEEAMWMRHPEYGPEIATKDKFRLIDLTNCKGRGFAAIGASRRYPIDYDVSGEDPQTSLHGVLRYRGKNYLYVVIEWEPKAQPLSLTEYNPTAFGKFERRCRFNNRR